MNFKQGACGAIITLGALVSGCSTTGSVSGPDSATGMPRTGPLSADAKREIDDGYRSTLNRLYESTPGSRELVAKARGVLVFPRVIAAGLVVGGQYGEGELRVNGPVAGYYRTTTGSVGWQIGAQSKALVFLFTTQDALDKFRSGSGWAGGVDASVAVLKLGANGEIQANADRETNDRFRPDEQRADGEFDARGHEGHTDRVGRACEGWSAVARVDIG